VLSSDARNRAIQGLPEAELARRGLEVETLTLGPSVAEEKWRIEVHDNGPGIPEDIQDKVFDPFFTTKPPGQGIGLGLNISHNIIVQKHKGKITLNSKPGRTCFSVRLPLHLKTTQHNGPAA
jgi:signal transduction histidine kinase